MFWGKTVVYIDNSNIYRGGKEAGWLPEYEKLMRFLETLGGYLWDVHFFAIEESSSERTSTSDFFDYLQKGLGFKLHLYTFGYKTLKCIHCGRFSQTSLEKGIDVGIATQIMRDFHNDAFDTLILMSANRDFIELLDFLRASGKKVKLLVWRNTMNQELFDFTNKWAIEVIYLDNYRPELEKSSKLSRFEEQDVEEPITRSSSYMSRDEFARRQNYPVSSNITDDDKQPERESQSRPPVMPSGDQLAKGSRPAEDEGTPLN
jgi:uncharacterized LabA/DUF88 family protein